MTFINPDDVKKKLIAQQLSDDTSIKLFDFETTSGVKTFVCIGKYVFEKHIFIALCVLYSQAETTNLNKIYQDKKLIPEVDKLAKVIIDCWEELGYTVPSNILSGIFAKETNASKLLNFVFYKLFKSLNIDKSIFQYSDQNLAIAVLHTIEELQPIN